MTPLSIGHGGNGDTDHGGGGVTVRMSVSCSYLHARTADMGVGRCVCG